MAQLNVTSVPWIDPATRRRLPLTGTSATSSRSRGPARRLRHRPADLHQLTVVGVLLPGRRGRPSAHPAEVPRAEDDVVEFWYVDHLHTGLGPTARWGDGVVLLQGQDGNTYYGGYYPYMYLTQDAAVFAGREPFGPRKIAYIITQEHGGKEDDGYGGFGNDHELHRRGVGTSSTLRRAGTTTPSSRRSPRSTATPSTGA